MFSHKQLVLVSCYVRVITRGTAVLHVRLHFVDVLVEESPAPCQIRHLLEEGGPRPLTFVLNANLLINVKLVTCEWIEMNVTSFMVVRPTRGEYSSSAAEL